MTDIFISYAREDKERAAVLAKELGNNGWSVWWDRKIPPGKTFSKVIEEAISAAKCVIVLWSKDSTASDWVQNEASEGARNKNLVPALIDDVQIPFEFRRIQAADLTDWQAQPDHPGFTNLINAVSHHVGQPAEQPHAAEPTEKPAVKSEAEIQPKPKVLPQPEPRPAGPGKKKMIVASALLAILIAVAGVWYFGSDGGNKKPQKVESKFELAIQDLNAIIQEGRTTDDIDKLAEINRAIQKRESYLRELTTSAREKRINVDAWNREIGRLLRQWDQVFAAKERELSGTIHTR